MSTTQELRDGREGGKTSTSQRAVSGEEPVITHLSARPRMGHLRSQSYLHPSEHQKLTPQSSNTMPVRSDNEKGSETSSRLSHKLHLHGHRHHFSQHDRKDPIQNAKKHRHTRSEAQFSGSSRDQSSSAYGISRTSTAVSSNPSEPALYPGSRGAQIPDLIRMASTRSHRVERGVHRGHDHTELFRAPTSSTVDTHHGLRRRATSDPRVPTMGSFRQNAAGGRGSPHSTRPMTEIEILVYKAEKAKRLARENVTETDVRKLQAELEEGEVELSTNLAQTTQSASDLMRRLDYAFDTIFQTADSLADTISSFSTLSQQSATLIDNFLKETNKLDADTRLKFEKYKTSLFSNRGARLSALETRGTIAAEKAEELSRRLGNCRVIVKNYEERELTKRRAWKGVVVGFVWGFSFVVAGFLLGFGIWWSRHYGPLAIHRQISVETVVQAKQVQGMDHIVMIRSGNESDLNVPEDVRVVLEDISRRHAETAYPSTTSMASYDTTAAAESKSTGLFNKIKAAGAAATGSKGVEDKMDQTLRMLDEL